MGATCSKNRACSLNRETAVNGVCLASQPSFVNCEVSGVKKNIKIPPFDVTRKGCGAFSFPFFPRRRLKNIHVLAGYTASAHHVLNDFP